MGVGRDDRIGGGRGEGARGVGDGEVEGGEGGRDIKQRGNVEG